MKEPLPRGPCWAESVLGQDRIQQCGKNTFHGTLKDENRPAFLVDRGREMLAFGNKLHSSYYYYRRSHSSLLSWVSVSVKLPALVPCSSISYTYKTRSAVTRVATMATVAIPQQPPSQHLPPPDSAFPSTTPSSSRASSRSGRKSRKSTDAKKPRSGDSRMSGFFPLGYKEAASQWV